MAWKRRSVRSRSGPLKYPVIEEQWRGFYFNIQSQYNLNKDDVVSLFDYCKITNQNVSREKYISVHIYAPGSMHCRVGRDHRRESV